MREAAGQPLRCPACNGEAEKIIRLYSVSSPAVAVPLLPSGRRLCQEFTPIIFALWGRSPHARKVLPSSERMRVLRVFFSRRLSLAMPFW